MSCGAKYASQPKLNPVVGARRRRLKRVPVFSGRIATGIDELYGKPRGRIQLPVSRFHTGSPENDVRLVCAAGCPGWGSNLLMKGQVRLIANTTYGESHSQTGGPHSRIHPMSEPTCLPVKKARAAFGAA